MLKKLIAIILCLSMMVSLCACGSKVENPDENQGGSIENGGQISNEASNDTQTEDGTSGNTQTNNGTSGNTQTSNGTSGNTQTSGGTSNNRQPVNLENAGVIICFGDSITEGMQVDKTQNYPSVLQKNLGNQITVINAGVSGEDSNTIMSRANAIEFTVTNDITFNAGQSEVTLNWKLFSTMDGGEIKYRYGKLGNGLSTKNVLIDGKPYTMRFEGAKFESDGKYILTRQDSSSALTLKKGVKVEFDYSGIYDKRYCTIVLMCANDSNLSATELISRYKKIAATSEKFIAIIPHYGTDYTKEFTEAFGNATVSLREYCKEEVWSAYNLEKDKKDEYYISQGYLSAKFVLDGKKGDCHLSALGYKVLGDLIYKKGIELGYWN